MNIFDVEAGSIVARSVISELLDQARATFHGRGPHLISTLTACRGPHDPSDSLPG